MLDGVTYVEPSHNPIIHEGMEPATVVITNAGPSSVEVRVWGEVLRDGSNQQPLAQLLLRAGNTRSVNGRLIRASLSDRGPSYGVQAAPFAAIGWRVVK